MIAFEDNCTVKEAIRVVVEKANIPNSQIHSYVLEAPNHLAAEGFPLDEG
jgi:hypothetical protein